jgi:metabotropic X receptor
VKDTCNNPLHAGEQAVDLFQGFMYRKVKNMYKEIVCTNDTVKNIVLSNKERFPYFFRTVPSDTFQAKAMIEVTKDFGWNYVSVVHTETEYGTTGYEALVKLAAKEKKLCLADPLVIHDNNFEDVITNLQANTMTKVVIVFADQKPAGELLEAAKRKNELRFIWVGSDTWAFRESVVYGREEVVRRAIALQPLRKTTSRV